MQVPLKYWKHVNSLEDAYFLIDIGVVLRSDEVGRLKRKFNDEDSSKIFAYLGSRFNERFRDLTAAEIILESFFMWLLGNMKEIYMITFIEKILEHPERNDIVSAIPQLLLGIEFVESQFKEQVFELSVFLIAQCGIQMHHFSKQYPDDFTDTPKVVQGINVFMLSISNANNYRARLCLINYFAMVGNDTGERYLSRCVQRFGYTLLNQITKDLFYKKTEIYAYRYMIDNLPYLLLSDHNCQMIVQEVMRYNMLKFPDKFARFLKAFSNDLKNSLVERFSPDDRELIVENYLKHMATFLKIISQVNQHKMSKEIILTLCLFEDYSASKKLLFQISHSREIRLYYRDLIGTLRHQPNQREYIENLRKFRSHQRGRKSSMIKKEVSIFHQIFYKKPTSASRIRKSSAA